MSTSKHVPSAGDAFRASPTATIITDASLQILAANPAYERLSGQHRSDWLGRRPRLIRAVDNGSDAGFDEGGADRAMGCEVMLHGRDDKARRAWMSWAPIACPHGPEGAQVVTFFELGARDAELDRWRHCAHHDALTGLANRSHLVEELDRALARAMRHDHRLAVLFIDLDGFKSVNDRLGHAAGDDLLAGVGRCLRQSLRAEDFVARYGGDEFVVLIEAPASSDDARTAASAVVAALAAVGTDASRAEPLVTASVGIALYPDHAIDARRLLQAADGAMYRAKRAGGNRCVIGDVVSNERQRSLAA